MDIKGKYISWKQKSAKQKVYKQLEMISFHLPKTGGVSFRNVLQSHYGNNLQLLYRHNFQSRINNEQPIWIPGKSKAIHGHFQPHKGLKEQFPLAKWVIWFRAPQDRIISHYNYWKANPQPGKAYLHFAEEIHSFKDFVCSKTLKGQVCMYQTYLRKIELSDFDFIGDLNNFDRDIKRFTEEFKIAVPDLKKHNRSVVLPNEDYTFTEEMLAVIEKELDIYNQIKS